MIIGRNFIGDIGIIELANGIQNSKRLTELNLSELLRYHRQQ